MNELKLQSHYNTDPFCLYPVQLLLLILKKLDITGLFNQHIKEPRQRKGIYSLSSLVFLGLCLFLFRFPSKNAFYTPRSQGHCLTNLKRLAGLKSAWPHPKTLDNFFSMLNPTDLEPIPFLIFKKLCSMKVFKNTSLFGLSQEGFTLSIDAFCSHVYPEINAHGPCPYCLKRQRKDEVWYLHMSVAACLVFECGLKLPLYLHPLKAKKEWVNLPDKQFKQECELSCLPQVLATIRSYLPKTRLTVLLDGLYATENVIKQLHAFNMGYAIVLKRLCVSKKLEKGLPFEQEVHVTSSKGRFIIEQTYRFAKAAHKDLLLNVVDMTEMARKKKTTRFALTHLKKIHYQWICHQTLSEKNVAAVCQKARLRWQGEDFFNTLKNRGFAVKHDFSRYFISQRVLMNLLLIAFAISSILSFALLRQTKALSLRYLMQKIFYDLLYLSEFLIFEARPLKQLRFCLLPGAG